MFYHLSADSAAPQLAKNQSNTLVDTQDRYNVRALNAGVETIDGLRRTRE